MNQEINDFYKIPEDPKLKDEIIVLLKMQLNQYRNEISSQSAEIQHLNSDLKTEKSMNNLKSRRRKNERPVIQDPNYIQFTPHNIERVKNDLPILYNIFVNALDKTKEFSTESIQLSDDINSISLKCHKLLVQNLNFPSEYICKKLSVYKNRYVSNSIAKFLYTIYDPG